MAEGFINARRWRAAARARPTPRDLQFGGYGWGFEPKDGSKRESKQKRKLVGENLDGFEREGRLSY